MTQKIAVIGGGAWGSAIASSLASLGHDVGVLTRRQDLAEALLSGVSPSLATTIGDIITAPKRAGVKADVVAGCHAVMVAVPVSATETCLEEIKPFLNPDSPVAFAAKGFVPGADDLIPHVAKTIIGNPLVMFSGPSFADEVAKGLPAALVAASDDDQAAGQIATLFTGGAMRVYSSPDPIGVAVGGAVKNVIAIASGITAGLGLGDNARAALMTRVWPKPPALRLPWAGRRKHYLDWQAWAIWL